jgi:hypothetical protein
MVRFQIPNAFLRGFEILTLTDPKDLFPLLDFLKRLPIGTGPKTFGDLFEKEFDNHKIFNRQIAATVYSLGGFFLDQYQKNNFDDLVDGLTHSFEAQSDSKHDPGLLKNLSENLRLILTNSGQLIQTYKAFTLLSEKDTVFRDNHIISDIRLLFKDDLNNTDRHGLIIHQLKIEAEESGEQSDYYFSLTISDLKKLQEQVSRALEKEKLIRDNYENSISFITITE